MFLQGSMAALPTPFTPSGLDEPAFLRLVERQVAGGTAGLVPCGITGEGPTLTEAERDRLTRLCVERAGGALPVIVATGTNCTSETIRRTRAAKLAGADAALVVTPYYNRPSQEGLYRHYAAVAAAVELPILLANVPARTGVDLAPSTVEQLARIPTIVGLVDAAGDPESPRVTALVAGRRFVQLCGDDASAVAFNLAGGRGCVSVAANVAPELCAALQAACRVKDWDRARALQDWLRPLAAALSCETDPGPVKHALSLLDPGFMPDPRLPLVPVGAGTAAAVAAALAGLRGPAGAALIQAA